MSRITRTYRSLSSACTTKSRRKRELNPEGSLFRNPKDRIDAIVDIFVIIDDNILIPSSMFEKIVQMLQKVCTSALIKKDAIN